MVRPRVWVTKNAKMTKEKFGATRTVANTLGIAGGGEGI